MDRVGEATLQLGKRGDEFASAAAILTSSGNGRLHERKTEAERSVNGVRAVRRGGRKDRHSKVFTAKGTRDRRVRLSPKTAILFYDVQERLGCDRPSKAIDWLMKEAKAAIDALDDPPPAAAPASSNRCAATNAAESKYDDIVNPTSGLDFFSGGAVPPPEELQGFFSWNYADCVSSAPLHYPAPAPAEFHLFAEREPLQSSHQFQGLEFRDQEFPTFKETEINSSFEQVSFLPTL